MKVIFALLYLVTGSIATHLSREELDQKINASYIAWTNAYNDQDVEALADLYTDDAINLPPGRPIMNGKAAFHASLSRLKASGKWPHWKTMTLNGLVWNGDYEAISLTISEAENADDSHWLGKGVRLFRITDGEVKIAMSVWNSDT